MAPQLKALYDELIRAFTARPSDLKKCTLLLGKLKVTFEVWMLTIIHIRLRFNW